MEVKSFDFREEKKIMKDTQEGFDMLKKKKTIAWGIC